MQTHKAHSLWKGALIGVLIVGMTSGCSRLGLTGDQDAGPDIASPAPVEAQEEPGRFGKVRNFFRNRLKRDAETPDTSSSAAPAAKTNLKQADSEIAFQNRTLSDFGNGSATLASTSRSSIALQDTVAPPLNQVAVSTPPQPSFNTNLSPYQQSLRQPTSLNLAEKMKVIFNDGQHVVIDYHALGVGVTRLKNTGSEQCRQQGRSGQTSFEGHYAFNLQSFFQHPTMKANFDTANVNAFLDDDGPTYVFRADFRCL